MALKLPRSSVWRVNRNFAVDLSGQAFFFLALLICTVAISRLGEFLLRNGAGPLFAAYAVDLFKYFLLATDVVVFVYSVIFQAARTIRRLRDIAE